MRVFWFTFAWTVVALTDTEFQAARALEDASPVRGLITLALLVTAAATWAGLDGHRGAPLDQLLIRWAVVAIAVAVLVPLLSFWRAADPPLGVLANGLVVVTPLVAAVLFAPAAIAAAAGSVGTTRRSGKT